MDFAIILAMERIDFITEEHVRAIGENNLESYLAQADVSGVPASFFRVSRRLLGEVDPAISRNNLAAMLFGFRFDSDEEAWTAIKYAEAVSIIKEAFEADDSLIEEEEIDAVVGQATLWEQNKGEEVESVKQIVEDHFEDPRNLLNFSYLEQALNNPAA